MVNPNLFIFYVDDPAKSAAFYADLLGKAPAENSRTFALFVLESGVKLGLWSKHTVEPAAVSGAGAVELAFALPGREAVESLFRDWTQRGFKILQSPVALDFGFTFVALDPDQHRLRVFAPR
jgi:catechol 2,3-dioxygenase-like lactoylglutathione lyase family enzyme